MHLLYHHFACIISQHESSRVSYVRFIPQQWSKSLVTLFWLLNFSLNCRECKAVMGQKRLLRHSSIQGLNHLFISDSNQDLSWIRQQRVRKKNPSSLWKHCQVHQSPGVQPGYFVVPCLKKFNIIWGCLISSGYCEISYAVGINSKRGFQIAGNKKKNLISFKERESALHL